MNRTVTIRQMISSLGSFSVMFSMTLMAIGAAFSTHQDMKRLEELHKEEHKLFQQTQRMYDEMIQDMQKLLKKMQELKQQR